MIDYKKELINLIDSILSLKNEGSEFYSAIKILDSINAECVAVCDRLEKEQEASHVVLEPEKVVEITSNLKGIRDKLLEALDILEGRN